MTVPMGGGKINPNPCNDTANKQNWQATSTFITNIFGDIVEIQGDITNIQDDLTNNYYNDPDEFFSDITLDGASYDPDTNTLTIETGGGGVDNYTVKSTVSDTTAEYLHSALADNATYDSDEDLLVANESIDAGSGNLRERLFVDVSAISGYDAGEVQLWGQDNTVSRLDTMTNWLFELEDYDSAKRQIIQHKVSEDAKWVEGGVSIIVRITGTVSARSGTTTGSGTVQQVDPTDLSTTIGSTFTAYNLSPRAVDGSTETVYARAVQVGDRYFIDAFDPIWLINFTGFGADKILYSDGTTSADIKFGGETCS